MREAATVIVRVFTDLHYTEDVRDMALDGERAAFYRRAFDAFIAPGADLLVSLGDISTTSNPNQMRHVVEELSRAPFPVHWVYGNHDTMFVNEAHMDEIYGRTNHYAFDEGGAHFVIIDTTNPFDMQHWGGHVDEGQLAWLAGEVEAAQGRPLVVMGHHALHGTTTPHSDEENHFIDNTDAVLDVLARHEGGPGLYLCGHTHRNGYVERDGWHYLMLADVPDIAGYLELDFGADAIDAHYRHFDDVEDHAFAHGIPVYGHLGRTAAEDGCTFEGVHIPLRS